ncbi:UNVERIFIED_CONTAM: Rubredoxin-2 [Sesamum latifolium]|uniref:Rubredoxin-2 n=1 Tax=Sesamum latifolium TaxID=2727402 RepID=A0AAW2YA29_9LAMI
MFRKFQLGLGFYKIPLSTSHTFIPILHPFRPFSTTAAPTGTAHQTPTPIPQTSPQTKTIIKSIDVSKEDKQEQPVAPQAEEPEPEPELENKLDKRRLEEKFAVVNTGVYECRSCGYKYDQAAGDPSYPIPPGLPFVKLPDDWRCPTCGASQNFFESKSMEIAGFAQNQQFGLGGNTLTSGQKALLIYGGLFLGFALFLSGYFLQ